MGQARGPGHAKFAYVLAAARSVHLPCICHASATRLPRVCRAYAVHARHLLIVHAQVAADGASYMVWSMKAEAEEAAGTLQDASRSYIKAANPSL